MKKVYISFLCLACALTLGVCAAWAANMPEQLGNSELNISGAGCSGCSGLTHPDCKEKSGTSGCDGDSYDRCHTSGSNTKSCDGEGGDEDCSNSDCVGSHWSDTCD